MFRIHKAVAFFIVVLYLKAAAAQDNQAQLKAVARIYTTVHTAKVIRDYYDSLPGADRQANAAAFSAWMESQGIEDIEAQARAVVGEQMMASLRSAIAGNRQKLVAGLDSLGKSLPPLRGMLRGDAFNLKKSAVADWELYNRGIRGGGGGVAQPAPDGPPPRPPAAAAAASSGGQLFYSAADLNSMIATAVEKAGSDWKARRAAAVNAITALGVRVNIVGTLTGRSNSIIKYEDATYESERPVYINNYRSDEDSNAAARSKGRELALSCAFNKLGFFIELHKCAVLNAANVQRANLPLNPRGLRRRKIESSVFKGKPGEGLKDSEVDGVYLKSAWTTGVGGYTYQQFEPVLVLRGGLLYSSPSIAPQAFLAKLSQEKQPQHWGRVSFKGNSAVVQWLEPGSSISVSSTYRSIYKAEPAKPGMRLSGSFSRLSGGGNTAYGGNTIISTASSFTFSSDGRFVFGSSTAAAGGNDYIEPAGANVTVRSTAKDRTGTYTLNGWNLELKFDDGRIDHRLFCSNDAKYNLICIGGNLFLKEKRK